MRNKVGGYRNNPINKAKEKQFFFQKHKYKIEKLKIQQKQTTF